MALHPLFCWDLAIFKFFNLIENREYSHKDPLFWPRDTFYPQKLALSSFTSSRTQATGFSF
jgi:hypothetical protein